MQMSALHRAAQRARVDQEVHVGAAQPSQLSSAQPGARHQQHDQPVPARAARPQQRDDLLVAGPVDGRSGSTNRCRARNR